MKSFLIGTCFVCGWLALNSLPTLAAGPPTITRLPVRGLQLDKPQKFVVEGTELIGNPRLLLNVEIQSQKLLPTSTPTKAEFEVLLAPPGAPSGIQLLRVVTDQGVSNALPLGIDVLPQLPFAPEIGALPAALHGILSGNQVLHTAFTGKQGQTVTVEVEAKRFGANCNPALRLLNDRRTQIAFNQGRATLGGDARLSVKLPADGRYTIELSDAAYQAAANSAFRLTIGAFDDADTCFPLAIQQGTSGSLRGVRTTSDLTDLPVTADKVFGMQPVDGLRAFVGFRPGFLASDFREVVASAEDEPAGAAPLGISGIVAAGKEQRHKVGVQPGQKYRVELYGQRIGSALDGVVIVRNDKGQQLAQGDDQPNTTDPGFDWTAPAGVQQAVFAVKDLAGRGGDDFFYRLVVRPANAPDFTLTAAEDRLQIPRAGTGVFKIDVTRQNYTGPIKLTFVGLPADIKPSQDMIPAGATQALIGFAGTAEQTSAGIISITGQSTAGDTLTRPVLTPETPTSQAQPWLRREIGFATIGKPALTADWDFAVANPVLPLGGKLSAHGIIRRSEQATGPVRLVLVTSQTVPAKPAKPAPKPAKKPAKNPPPAAKPEDDLDRALRLTELVTIPAGESAAPVYLAVPGDLPPLDYDVVLRAELLSADGKNVIATAHSPVRRLAVQGGIEIKLTGVNKIEARAGVGPTGKLIGKVVRSSWFQGPVKLQLEGLPDNSYANTVEIPANQTDFEYPVTLSFGTPAGELKSARLLGLGQPDADDPSNLIRSNELSVVLQVFPGEKPQGEKLLEIFEDRAEFVAALGSGGGQISLINDDKYKGTAAVKVTPDQRFNEKLPGLGVKIREKPNAGEYRYLRFAWKKKGGTQICLQLNHDGAWGPTETATGKFRYHAGQGECFGGSLSVNDKLPGDWVVVTRDLFADFGEFTLTGLALSPVDGDYALFDHLYLGRDVADLDTVKP